MAYLMRVRGREPFEWVLTPADAPPFEEPADRNSLGRLLAPRSGEVRLQVLGSGTRSEDLRIEPRGWYRRLWPNGNERQVYRRSRWRAGGKLRTLDGRTYRLNKRSKHGRARWSVAERPGRPLVNLFAERRNGDAGVRLLAAADGFEPARDAWLMLLAAAVVLSDEAGLD